MGISLPNNSGIHEMGIEPGNYGDIGDFHDMGQNCHLPKIDGVRGKNDIKKVWN